MLEKDTNRRAVMEEEFDTDDGRLVLSYQLFNKDGEVILSLNLDRDFTPFDIANSLKDDALDILLNASETVAAEEVLKVTRMLTEEARRILGQEI